MQRSERGSWFWPLSGVAAGVLGAIGHLFSASMPTAAERQSGIGVIDTLNHQDFQIGAVAGIAATFFLLVFAAGWRRWAAANAPLSLAADLVSLALVASAGAMILGYGFKGSLATYLPGAPEANSYPRENLLSVFMFDDFGPFIAWYGVSMAAVAVAWLACKERRLPIWLGILSLITAVIPYGALVAVGLPGMPGVIAPFWMISFGIAFAWRLRAMPASPEINTL